MTPPLSHPLSTPPHTSAPIFITSSSHHQAVNLLQATTANQRKSSQDSAQQRGHSSKHDVRQLLHRKKKPRKRARNLINREESTEAELSNHTRDRADNLPDDVREDVSDGLQLALVNGLHASLDLALLGGPRAGLVRDNNAQNLGGDV